jgi:WD40 repeat protein
LIRRLIYLDKRSKLTGAASLIASGPGGYVHFWNIYNTKTPMGLFQASQYKCISDMVVNTANSLLVVSDIEGFVSVWDIKSYCMDKKNIINSKCMMKWRAHTQCITKMSLIETWNVVVTGSKDNSVRIWTLGGCYIGIIND